MSLNKNFSKQKDHFSHLTRSINHGYQSTQQRQQKRSQINHFGKAISWRLAMMLWKTQHKTKQLFGVNSEYAMHQPRHCINCDYHLVRTLYLNLTSCKNN